MENNLPESWELVKLLEYINFLPTGVKEFKGEREYYSTGSIKEDKNSSEGKFSFQKRPARANRIAEKGDVFQARMKETDKAILVDDVLDGQLFSTGFIQLRPYGDTYSNRLLYYFIKSDLFLSQKDELATGSTQEALTDGNAEEILIPFPPLEEQHRIVAKLDELMEKTERSKKRLEKIPLILKRFRQSVLAAAVSGNLTEEWRENNKNVESAEELIKRIKKERKNRYEQACIKAKEEGKRKPSEYDNLEVKLRDDLELFELPEDWGWVDFRFVMDEQEAFCYGVVQPGENSEDGNYLIRAGDLKNGTVNLNELRKIPLSIDKLFARSRVKGGEILITVVGANVGDVAIAPLSCSGYNIARAVSKIPINDFEVGYLFQWLNSEIANRWMKSDAREVARPTLNLEQLRTLPIPLAPLKEQHEIVRRVEALFAFADKIETRYTKAKAQFDKLPQALLAKAFKGELVEQDEEDESAEKLLERIKKEKMQKENVKNKKANLKKYKGNGEEMSLVAEK